MASGTIPLSSRVKMDLLWTNSSPSSNFAPQNIPVDLSAYDYYAVHCRFGASYNRLLPIAIYPVDDATNQVSMVALSNNQVGARTFHYVASTPALVFEEGKYNGATNNAYAIPVSIYGIKL